MSAEGTIAEVLAGTARYAVVCGDATAVLATLPDGCAHVAYFDGPYGLSTQSTADVIACLRAWLDGRVYTHGKAGFMSAEWDAFVPGPEAFREVFRALKPGAYCVAFSSTRTVDLLGIAVRLAGFEMREGWAWNFSAAMPKSLNVGKAIDREAGAEREVIGQRDRYLDGGKRSVGAPSNGGTFGGETFTVNGVADITAPATKAAAQWEGYGTTVKPAYEPLVVARKPLAGTVAANVQRHGCGALNIDAGRIGATKRVPSTPPSAANAIFGARPASAATGDSDGYDPNVGRFPAALALVHSEGCELVGTTRVRTGTAVNHNRSADDRTSWFGTRKSQTEDAGHADADGMETCDEWVCVEGCAAAELARQSGERTSGSGVKGKRSQVSTYGTPSQDLVTNYDGDTGTAARFFFQAKASARDRLAYITCSAGCAHHETVAGVREARATARDATQEHPHGWCVACGAARHHHLHSTVKPLDLARYHARLLSLPSHVDPLALVPFCGSGPEARALLEMGFRVIAVDLDPRHCAMTRHRLSQPLDAPQAKPARKAPRPTTAAPVAPAAPSPVAEATPLVAVPSRPRGRQENAAQLSLFGGAK